jgi:class 3 adenylate cyclase
VGVHIGARVGALAGGGEVWVSSTVKDLTAGSGLTYEDRGEHELKGVPDRWHLYRVMAG